MQLENTPLGKASPKLFKSTTTHVKPEWIDHNGHLNVAYYVVLFDHCVDEFFDQIGLGATYVALGNSSTFTVEAHITYQKELKVDTPVCLTLQVLDYDEKRLHLHVELFHATEGFLSATWEQMSLHVDMNTKRASPFPKDVLEEIDQMLQSHKEISQSPVIGKKIQITRK